MNVTIKVDRDSRSNTSIIRIERNNSDDSGENKITPVNNTLSPYIGELSLEINNMSPGKAEELSIEKDIPGDSGDSGDNSQSFVSDANQDISDKNKELDQLELTIGYKHPFYYCKQHPQIENIHYDEIVDHIQRSYLHKTSKHE